MRCAGKSLPGAAMATVSTPAPTKSHLKKLPKASVVSMPLKSRAPPAGWPVSSSAVTPRTAKAPIVRTVRRALLFRQITSARNRSSVPNVSASSGRNDPTEPRLRATSERNESTRSIGVSAGGLKGAALDGLDEDAERAVDRAEDGLRVEAEDDGDHAERIERHPLTPVEVRVALVDRVELAQEHPVYGVEVIRRRDDHADRGDDHERRVRRERAREDH